MKRLLAMVALLFASSTCAVPNLTGQWTIYQTIATPAAASNQF
jgi:hypothetical protein